jgi:hypothetical protein
MDAKSLPLFNMNLPRINLSDLPCVGTGNSPEFFDVVYLDDDMLEYMILLIVSCNKHEQVNNNDTMYWTCMLLIK